MAAPCVPNNRTIVSDGNRPRMTISTATSPSLIAGCAPVLMQVAGLTKRYGDQNALADISFSVDTGAVLKKIGPNGAGKTTLLEAIAGLLPADDGRVLWRGAPLPLRQRRECMFYLPDGLRPWEDQYVARVIGLFTAAYGRSEGFVAGIVRALGLAPVLRKRVLALSKGYGRRLMQGRACAAPARGRA